MILVRAVLPIIVVIAASLLAALPWGIAGSLQATLPMLVAGLVYLWNVRRPSAVPNIVAFAAGIGLDAVTQGPLGYWPLVFLAASACAALAREMLRNPEGYNVLVHAAAYLAAMASLAALAWGLRSLFDLSPVGADVVVVALATSAVAYPLLGGLVALSEAATAPDRASVNLRSR